MSTANVTMNCGMATTDPLKNLIAEQVVAQTPNG